MKEWRPGILSNSYRYLKFSHQGTYCVWWLYIWTVVDKFFSTALNLKILRWEFLSYQPRCKIFFYGSTVRIYRYCLNSLIPLALQYQAWRMKKIYFSFTSTTGIEFLSHGWWLMHTHSGNLVLQRFIPALLSNLSNLWYFMSLSG